MKVRSCETTPWGGGEKINRKDPNNNLNQNKNGIKITNLKIINYRPFYHPTSATPHAPRLQALTPHFCNTPHPISAIPLPHFCNLSLPHPTSAIQSPAPHFCNPSHPTSATAPTPPLQLNALPCKSLARSALPCKILARYLTFARFLQAMYHLSTMAVLMPKLCLFCFLKVCSLFELFSFIIA